MQNQEWFVEFLKGNIDLRFESEKGYKSVLKLCKEKNIYWKSGIEATKSKEYIPHICLSCHENTLTWYIYGDSNRGSYPVSDNMIEG